MEIREKIIQATSEIFSSMVMMDVAASAEELGHVSPLEDTITGIIGLAGVQKGVLAVHFPIHIACSITSNFLGMDVDQVNEDVEDAIGEIANMLGGNVKSFLSENGRDIELSLPSTISGKEYDFQTLRGADRTTICFLVDEGRFVVDLQLEG